MAGGGGTLLLLYGSCEEDMNAEKEVVEAGVAVEEEKSTSTIPIYSVREARAGAWSTGLHARAVVMSDREEGPGQNELCESRHFAICIASYFIAYGSVELDWLVC